MKWDRSNLPERFLTGILLAPGLLLVFGLLVLPVAWTVRLSLAQTGNPATLRTSPFDAESLSTQTYLALIRERYFRQVSLFSVLLGIAVTAINLAIAYPLAYIFASWRPLFRNLALLTICLPKLTNVLVLIYGFELLFSNRGPVNESLLWLGVIDEPIRWYHNLLGVILGEVYLLLPYSLLILTVTLLRIEREWLLAARGLGASASQAFWRVIFPLSLPGLSVAALVSVAWGIGAFVGPSLLGSPEELTLAVDIHRQIFENQNWPRGAAEAVTLLLLTTFVAVVFSSIGRRAKARSGR